MVDKEAQTGEDVHLSASEVCLCGPYHALEERRTNQFLKVDRRCTDKMSLLLIFVYFVFMLFVWFYAVDKGQLLFIMNGMDWAGRACGSGDLLNYPHQAWSNPLMKDIGAGAVCVKHCPAPIGGGEIAPLELMCICNPKYWPEKFAKGPHQSVALLEECSKPLAKLQGYFVKGVEAQNALLNDASTGTTGGVDQPCAYVHRTKWAMRKCVPWLSSANLAKVVDQSKSTTGTVNHDFIADIIGKTSAMVSAFMTDIMDCRWILLVCVFTAIMFSLATMVMLRYCVKLVAHAILILLFVLFVLCTFLAWQEYSNYATRVDTVPALLTQAEDKQSMYIFLSCFVVGCILSVLHICFSVFMYSELDAAISIIEVSSSTFEDAPQILLYPMLHVFAFILMLVGWLVGAVLLYSAGDINTDAKGVAYMSHTPMLRSMAGFYTFGLFWGCSFINAMGYMIVAGTVYLCTFAGSRGRRDVPNSVMTTSLCTIVRYHMGTAALGSLILVLLWPFRFVVNIFARLGSWENENMRYLCCCFQCCVSCFDSCMKYMNKMAYLQTVLHGFSFCNSAFSGMACVLKGLNIIAPTTFISSFVIVVIKLSVTLLVTAIADGALTSGGFNVKKSDIEYAWVPFAAVALSTYVIITGFMLILEVAIDAIMVAYCEARFEPRKEGKDGERPDGGIREEQLPKELLQHMEVFGKVDADGHHVAMAAPSEETALLEGQASKDWTPGQE